MVPIGGQSRSSHYTFSIGSVSDRQWQGCTVVFNFVISVVVDYWPALNVVVKDDYQVFKCTDSLNSWVLCYLLCSLKLSCFGVPAVAQWVNDPALLQLWLQIRYLAPELLYAAGVAEKEKNVSFSRRLQWYMQLLFWEMWNLKTEDFC